MTETALRDRETSSAAAWLMRSLPSPNRGAGALDPVLTQKTREADRDAAAVDSGSGRRDWSASLDLIHEATAAIRISEERSSELEHELERTALRAQERAESLEAQLAAAQNRAELAERRAAEAEEWLARLHDAVVAGFTRKGREDASLEEASSAA